MLAEQTASVRCQKVKNSNYYPQNLIDLLSVIKTQLKHQVSEWGGIKNMKL